MRTAKVYPTVTKRIYHAEITTCPSCGTRLRRYATVSQRTLVTLDGVVRVVHSAYRCPQPDCPTATRPYRSTVADGLALPGFTFGLDVLLLVGHLRLAQHQTVDQIHLALQERLTPLGVTISRREILYLFDAYCTLLRTSQALAHDHRWQEHTRANGGVIISIDGIQPDKGSETIYLVRDVVTGRLLAAENVRISDTPTITALLRSICELDVPVVGAVSDAQESLLQAIAALWPDIPHQVCQFHYLREASRPMYDVDRKVRKQIRKAIQQDVRTVRRQLEAHTTKLPRTDADDQRTVAQCQILDDYALAAQTVLNLDALQPFQYASPAVDGRAQCHCHQPGRTRKRGSGTTFVAAKRTRLLEVIARREQWRDDLILVRRLHANVVAAEGILSGAILESLGQPVTNTTVRERYDAWCAHLQTQLADPALVETERRCLKHFLHVTTNMAPRLFNCYNVTGMPRTNNDMEGFIRSVKTRYRRISGRTNWNSYLIRYGARVAFYEARARTGELGSLEESLRQVRPYQWRQGRAEHTARQQEQRKQHRVRHQREAFLADLEARWAVLEAGT